MPSNQTVVSCGLEKMIKVKHSRATSTQSYHIITRILFLSLIFCMTACVVEVFEGQSAILDTQKDFCAFCGTSVRFLTGLDKAVLIFEMDTSVFPYLGCFSRRTLTFMQLIGSLCILEAFCAFGLEWTVMCVWEMMCDKSPGWSCCSLLSAP